MKYLIALNVLILTLFVIPSTCDIWQCSDSLIPPLSELPGIGPTISDIEKAGQNYTGIMRTWVCKAKTKAKKVIKNVVNKVKKGYNELKINIKELASDFKTKLHSFKARTHRDPDESGETVPYKSSEFLFSDQMCGHGHILDSLGNCRKLRK